jgi:hypothetical protein
MMALVNGKVIGNPQDIENWVRDFWEQSYSVDDIYKSDGFTEYLVRQINTGAIKIPPTPLVMKDSAGGDSRFSLSLLAYVFSPKSGLQHFTCAMVKVTGWSNGTADVLLWGPYVPPYGIAPALFKKGKIKREAAIKRMGGEFVKRFPYATREALRLLPPGESTARPIRNIRTDTAKRVAFAVFLMNAEGIGVAAAARRACTNTTTISRRKDDPKVTSWVAIFQDDTAQLTKMKQELAKRRKQSRRS